GPRGTTALALRGAAGATAVVNVTADDATAPGYVTVWPSGQPQPDTSNLNQERAHQTVANLVIVPVGPDGTVGFFSLSAPTSSSTTSAGSDEAQGALRHTSHVKTVRGPRC